MPLNAVSTLDPFFKIKSPHSTESDHDSPRITRQFHSSAIMNPLLHDMNEINILNKDEVQSKRGSGS